MLAGMRLEEDRRLSQAKLDDERRMQAGRAQRLAQLQLEYLKKENEERSASQREMQQAWTVHYEQAKIAAE